MSNPNWSADSLPPMPRETATKGARTCTACNELVTDSYCSNCGQKAGERKTTLRTMFTDLVTNIFSLERSVFATMFKLLVDPQRVIDNYWLGHRGYFASPGKVFFYGLAFAALHIAYVNKEILGVSMELNNLQAQVFFWMLFFPMLAMSSVLTFIRKRQPVTRHLISLLYLGSTFFLIFTVIQDFVIMVYKDALNSIPFALFFGSVFVWNARVFIGPKKRWQVLGYGLLQLLIFTAIFASFIGLMFLLKNEVAEYKESLMLNTDQ